MSDDLTLAIVLGAAVIDSINPCAIGVILFLSSALLRVSSKKDLLLKLGGIYITTVYVVYTLSGLGLIWFQYALISKGFAEVVGIIVGGLVIVIGLIEIKEFFWYGKWISLEMTPRHKEKLTKMAENFSFVGIMAIGGFVAVVELPCTGGPYLAITALLAKSFDKQAFIYLLIYNFIFVLPLLVILLMIYFGASTLRLKEWRLGKRKWMNLATGLLLISLGALLIAYYRFGWYL
jgi:cytochrome c biogenesis protein CcdA